MTTSDKADRKALPPPRVRRAGGRELVAPSGSDRAVLAELLAATLAVERVSATAHFFDDLGANSLLLARFAARVRAGDRAAADRDSGPVPAPHRDSARRARRPAVWGPGAPAVPRAVERPSAAAPPAVRSGADGAVLRVGHRRVGPDGGRASAGCGAPRPSSTCGSAPWWSPPRPSAATSSCRRRPSGCWSAASRPQEFPLWGARHLRFWVVQRILRANPLAVFVGVAALQPVPAVPRRPHRCRRRRPDPRRSRVRGPAHDRLRRGRP